jgi:hypothetical protein
MKKALVFAIIKIALLIVSTQYLDCDYVRLWARPGYAIVAGGSKTRETGQLVKGSTYTLDLEGYFLEATLLCKGDDGICWEIGLNGAYIDIYNGYMVDGPHDSYDYIYTISE